MNRVKIAPYLNDELDFSLINFLGKHYVRLNTPKGFYEDLLNERESYERELGKTNIWTIGELGFPEQRILNVEQKVQTMREASNPYVGKTDLIFEIPGANFEGVNYSELVLQAERLDKQKVDANLDFYLVPK